MAVESVNSYTYPQWDIGRNLWVDATYKDYTFLFENEGGAVSYISKRNTAVDPQDGKYAIPIPNIVLTVSGKVWVYYCNETWPHPKL